MDKPSYSSLTCLLLALVSGALMWSEDSRNGKVLHPNGAEFQQSLGQVLFSSNGSLYVAYRLREKNQSSSVLRVVRFDPASGEPTASEDFAVPQVRLPRVSSQFIESQDSGVLAYAELHSPQVLLTMDATTLKPISSSNAAMFAGYELGLHITNFDSRSLVLSAERPRPRRPITIECVREVTLNPANLNEVISDQKISLDERPNELQRWMKLSREDLSLVAPLEEGALGFSNLKTHGWVRVLDDSGKTIQSLEIRDCGPAKAALTEDRQYGVAICERIITDEFRHERGWTRKAIIFEVNSLKVLRYLPASGMTLKERGSDPEDVWFASPSPAIWRGKDELLVALPDSSSTIKLYTVSLQPETANAK